MAPPREVVRVTECVVEASEMRQRRRGLAASADEVGNLEGGEEERGKHGVFDVDVDELVGDPHPPPTDEPLERVDPHPLEVADVEGVEDVSLEAVETEAQRLRRRLLKRMLA